MIEEPARLGADDKAVLLCEESAVTRRITVIERAKIIELTTMDFLLLLEREQRIQSAEAVSDLALAAGRTPSRIEKFGTHDPDIREAVLDTLRSTRNRKPPNNAS